MGIEPFLLAYAVNLIVAQRLLRKVCEHCRELEQNPDVVLLHELGFTDEDVRKSNQPCVNNLKQCAGVIQR